MSAGTVLRLVAVMVLWASCFPLITIGLDLAPHLAFAAMRAALAGACLLLLGVALHRPVPRGVSSWGLIAVVGAGATSLGFFGMFHAAEFIAPGLAHAVLGERLKILGMTGLALGFAGIVAIAWPGLTSYDGTGYGLGIGYVALAAAGVAIGNLAIKQLTGKADAIMAMGFQMLIGAVPLALLSVSTEDISSLAWSAEFVLVLLVLSVFGTSLAFWLWFSVLREVDLSRANAFTFLVPILGLAIGATVFTERLASAQAVGVVLVLAGIVLVQRGAPASGAVSVTNGVGRRSP